MKILGDKILHETRWLKLVERTYLNKDNEEQKWVLAQRNNDCAAVMIIPYHYDENGKKTLVITKEFRPALEGYEWGFPAGLIDDNEPVLKTAMRELHEETGLELDEVIMVSPPVYNSAGMTDESISMVWVKCSGTPTNKYQEPGENIETFLMTPTDVDKLLRKNVKIGAKSWIIMKRFTRDEE